MTDKIHRSAITGEFVTAEHASENPDTTVSEQRTRRPASDCSDLTNVAVVRDRGGVLWGVVGPDRWLSLEGSDVRIGAVGLGLHHGPLTPLLDLDGQPIVRTVGDLTARHIGRRVRIGKTPPDILMGLSWREVGVRVHLFTPDAEAAWQNLPLNAPCEVLS